MKKILLIMCILMVAPVFAYPYNDIDRLAKDLKGHDIDSSIDNVENWVNNNIEHKFFWYPRGIRKTFDNKLGDCTDRAMLKGYMLRKQGYKIRFVHGFADLIFHDWYEVRFKNHWYAPDEESFNLRKIGYGIW